MKVETAEEVIEAIFEIFTQEELDSLVLKFPDEEDENIKEKMLRYSESLCPVFTSELSVHLATSFIEPIRNKLSDQNLLKEVLFTLIDRLFIWKSTEFEGVHRIESIVQVLDDLVLNDERFSHLLVHRIETELVHKILFSEPYLTSEGLMGIVVREELVSFVERNGGKITHFDCLQLILRLFRGED